MGAGRVKRDRRNIAQYFLGARGHVPRNGTRGAPSDGRQFVDRGRNRLACCDQIGKQALVDTEIALVLSAIPHIMAPGEHPPDVGTEAKGVRKCLEHDVSVRCSIPCMAKRCQAKRVRGVVGQSNRPSTELASLSASASRLSPDRLRPANSLASGDSLRRAWPGPQRFSSGETTLVANQP